MLFAAIITALIIGYMSQSWKKRTGAFWGISAFFFYYFMSFLTIRAASDIISASSEGELAGIITPGFVTCVVFGLIIATLPEPKEGQ